MSKMTAKTEWGHSWQSANSGLRPINLDKWMDKGVGRQTLITQDMAKTSTSPLFEVVCGGTTTNGIILDTC